MNPVVDGPATSLFQPLPFRGNAALDALAATEVLSAGVRAAAKHAPGGDCLCWGIPLRVQRIALANGRPVMLELPATKAEWLVFMHTSDWTGLEEDAPGLPTRRSGFGRLGDGSCPSLTVTEATGVY